jgi:hypothetical protein
MGVVESGNTANLGSSKPGRFFFFFSKYCVYISSQEFACSSADRQGYFQVSPRVPCHLLVAGELCDPIWHLPAGKYVQTKTMRYPLLPSRIPSLSFPPKFLYRLLRTIQNLCFFDGFVFFLRNTATWYDRFVQVLALLMDSFIVDSLVNHFHLETTD